MNKKAKKTIINKKTIIIVLCVAGAILLWITIDFFHQRSIFNRHLNEYQKIIGNPKEFNINAKLKYDKSFIKQIKSYELKHGNAAPYYEKAFALLDNGWLEWINHIVYQNQDIGMPIVLLDPEQIKRMSPIKFTFDPELFNRITDLAFQGAGYDNCIFSHDSYEDYVKEIDANILFNGKRKYGELEFDRSSCYRIFIGMCMQRKLAIEVIKANESEDEIKERINKIYNYFYHITKTPLYALYDGWSRCFIRNEIDNFFHKSWKSDKDNISIKDLYIFGDKKINGQIGLWIIKENAKYKSVAEPFKGDDYAFPIIYEKYLPSCDYGRDFNPVLLGMLIKEPAEPALRYTSLIRSRNYLAVKKLYFDKHIHLGFDDLNFLCFIRKTTNREINFILDCIEEASKKDEDPFIRMRAADAVSMLKKMGYY